MPSPLSHKQPPPPPQKKILWTKIGGDLFYFPFPSLIHVSLPGRKKYFPDRKVQLFFSPSLPWDINFLTASKKNSVDDGGCHEQPGYIKNMLARAVLGLYNMIVQLWLLLYLHKKSPSFFAVIGASRQMEGGRAPSSFIPTPVFLFAWNSLIEGGQREGFAKLFFWRLSKFPNKCNLYSPPFISARLI